jgi:putative NADH-flavin reductase
MPAIVIGADTDTGLAIIDALIHPGREVRAFVSNPDIGSNLKERGVKVALGDVSDDSHIEGAALHCFTAVLVCDAARDGRERSFADTETAVLEAWGRAVVNARVHRVIWVCDGEPPPVEVPEVTRVSPAEQGFALLVADLDDARVI